MRRALALALFLAALLAPSLVFAADATLASTGANSFRAQRSAAFTTASIGYYVYADTLQDLVYSKTTDGGTTWGAGVNVFTGNVLGYSIWYESWGSGTGTKIHMVWWEDVGSDILYRALDTNGDTLGTQTTVFDGLTATSSYAAHVWIAKMRGGNLYAGGCIDAGAECGLFRSTDSGATWTSRLSPYEANPDITLGFPGNEADNQDAWILYHDASVDEVTLKVHDDSANTNAESVALLTTAIETAADANRQLWAGAINPVNNHLYVCIWTDFDPVAGTADGRCWDINGTGSITEKGSLFTDKDDTYYPALFVSAAGDVYVTYNGKLDGTETLLTTTGIYYRISTDGMGTWGAETAYSSTISDWRQVYTPLNGPRFMAAWWDISATDVMHNAASSVEPPAATSPCVIGGGVGGGGCVIGSLAL